MSENGNGRIQENGNGDARPTTQRLQGKVAIITGAARGIGAASAKIFAENGAKVIVADILDEVGQKLCQETIPSSDYVHCDVSKEEDVAAAVELALNMYGRLDIMFNNAGIVGPIGSILEVNMEDVKEVVGVNVNGVLHGIKHAARAMVGAKRGCILCTSSSAGIMGGLAPHPYTLTKEAIIGLAKSAACELGEHGIRVNCISPHGVPSEMMVASYKKILGNDKVTAEDVRRQMALEGSLLQGKSATVEDSAWAALFLASDEARFISGHNLVVDGGFTSAYKKMRFIYRAV